MANYGAPSQNYGQPQGYNNFPGMPSFMGPPPNMGAAPGMSPPPGMNTAQSSTPGHPAGLPSQFQPPSGINFNAKVIRLGVPQGKSATTQGYEDRRGGDHHMGGGRGRMGLGADMGRQPRGDTLIPPTREEVSRTIFIGGLVDGMPDDATLEEILGVGRGLRKWSRVTDADNKACDFGFAEYDDASSLEIATKLFEDVELPLKRKKDDDGEVKKSKLSVIVDPESVNYIKQWTKADENDFQFKLDNAREDLTNLLGNLSNGLTADGNEATDAEGDVKMEDGQNGAEFVPVPASGEDELSEVPPEMREQVAAEIKAFRDRSTRRDLERLRREEEMERTERERDRGVRPSRLASPPTSAPTGPGGANGVPVAPRDRAVPGAPIGPKGYRGAQIPKDYVDGVNFVNGNAEDDEDDSASDEELESRRREKVESELQQRYLEQEKRWMQKEKAHFMAVERQQKEEEAAAASKERRREELAERLRSFDDETEKRKPTVLYYKDRRTWMRERRIVRGDEKRRDEYDRRDEMAEKDVEQRKMDTARAKADDFLAQTSRGMSTRADRFKTQERQTFSLNLSAKKEEEPEESKPDRNTMADVEGLLDDDDDAAAPGTTLKPLKMDFKPLAAGEKMTDDERKAATRQLAASIPNNLEQLFSWSVKWNHVPESLITDKLRPYTQKKLFESLGVQEDELVEVIEKIIRRHGSPREIVQELDMLDEEAEPLARKIWKMVVFYSECDAAGLEV